MAAQLFVTYPASDGGRFDQDYYVATHLPLVEQSWGAFGLVSAQGFFPPKGGANVAVAVLTFADEVAIQASLASEATAGVMADVANFTNIQPAIARGVAL